MRGGQSTASRTQLRKYSEVISLWCARFDTQSISRRVDLPEWLVAKWVANFRELARGAA